ncbi:GNAT family N-acetyltransferase [Leucothrix mucor]|uniref:GNAT family N-acetyltransferase n=1 Tax=Leucothrix mucor TaxID=45248 RepID=UPI0003B381B9|nr:GNAT family N-acetyltransferase [Leucothrix mucor]
MGELNSIRLLSETDDRSSFDCGKPSLNNWFERHAWKNQNNGASRTYVITKDGAIAGYITLAAGEIHRAFLPKGKQRNMPDPVPVILLAQLAVDTTYQGAGISKSLLAAAFSYAVKASNIIGGFALLTHPLDEDIRAFYSHWGFQLLDADPRGSMYIRICDLKASGIE